MFIFDWKVLKFVFVYFLFKTRLIKILNYFRGLFIIDGDGTLRQITINDLPVGRSVDETLRLVQAFQYTDKYGEGNFFKYLKMPNY